MLNRPALKRRSQSVHNVNMEDDGQAQSRMYASTTNITNNNKPTANHHHKPAANHHLQHPQKPEPYLSKYISTSSYDLTNMNPEATDHSPLFRSNPPSQTHQERAAPSLVSQHHRPHGYHQQAAANESQFAGKPRLPIRALRMTATSKANLPPQLHQARIRSGKPAVGASYISKYLAPEGHAIPTLPPRHTLQSSAGGGLGSEQQQQLQHHPVKLRTKKPAPMRPDWTPTVDMDSVQSFRNSRADKVSTSTQLLLLLLLLLLCLI